jgi:hypothetical protein
LLPGDANIKLRDQPTEKLVGLTAAQAWGWKIVGAPSAKLSYEQQTHPLRGQYY